MSSIVIDGAQGEGGGQVLRTALTLAMVTGQDIELVNIRAGRKKTGLLRQHLTCVLASQAISGATVQGAELGSSTVHFSPGQLKSGEYHFAISTAGSTVLVCQTILPALALADGKSVVTLEGGTHNGMSPSLCFFEQSYLPVLAAMGVRCRIDIKSLGFDPAGGGKWQITIEPVKRLHPIDLLESGGEYAEHIGNCALKAMVSAIPESIGQREITKAKSLLDWSEADSQVSVVQTPGPGNSFQVSIDCQTHKSVFELVGQLGMSAERVAKRVVGRVNKFVHSGAAVEEHLADQLLLLMVLAGGGSYTTTKPSLHTTTNIAVIKQLLGKEIQITQLSEHVWRVSV